MKRSTDHMLTTHTGSLPRPPDVAQMLLDLEAGKPVDRGAFNAAVRTAVFEVVRRQVEMGIDIPNDGEMGKPGYATYIKDRASGFGGQSVVSIRRAESDDFPEWHARYMGGSAVAMLHRPACNGPIAWSDFDAVRRDIDNLKDAAKSAGVEEAFMTAASPGVIASFLGDEYYGSHEKYLEALAAVMRDEYNAIYAAGFLLQLDCPDLAFRRHSLFADLDDAAYRSLVAQHLEVLDEATKEIPPDRMRLHLCWGNYEGPHHLDVPLEKIVDLVLAARPAAISFEGANPRHEHEWAIWKEVKLPPGKIIIPGVIDSTTNFIEHPELVAQRIVRYADVVGKENVIAGTDCGFGTFVTSNAVDARIAWAKLQAMVDGARIATEQLW